MQVVLPRITLTLDRDAVIEDIQFLQASGEIREVEGAPDPAMLFSPEDSEAERDAKIEAYLRWYIPSQIVTLAQAQQMGRVRQAAAQAMAEKIGSLVYAIQDSTVQP